MKDRNNRSPAPNDVPPPDSPHFRQLADLCLDPVYVVDVAGSRIIYLNSASDRLFGSDLAGGLGWCASLSRVHPDDLPQLDRVRRDILGGDAGDGGTVDCRILDPAAGWRVVRLREQVLDRAADGTALTVLGTAREAAGHPAPAVPTGTDATLQKREALLRELNHRIKNSLQLVASLLRLQAGHVRETSARAAFDRACQRVTAVAEVHARLYMTEEVGELDFGGYIAALVPRLAGGTPKLAPHVEAVVVQAEGTLDVDRAIPLGLVANELVGNALLHAFRATGRGRVTVGFRSDDRTAHLWVADDGAGPVPDTAPPGTLGLRLVKALVGQVGGTLKVVRAGGLRYDITVPLKHQPACPPPP